MHNRFFPNYDSYKITSPFGMRTLGGKRKMHNGIDLVAKNKNGASVTDYITAHSGGTVCDVGFNASAGNFVKLRTGSDVVMVYYHLREACPLKKGTAVLAGDILGYMGSTGNSTGAHLHFGIQVGGQWIDPRPWLDCDYPPKVLAFDIPVLKRGARGATVAALQALLTGRGHSLTADGSFGPATEAAVKEFQAANGLTVDGSVGRKTWSALLGLETAKS